MSITSAYYGVVAEPAQPTYAAGAQPNPEATAPMATTAPAGRLPLFSQAGFWIVALLALAAGLVHASIRFS